MTSTIPNATAAPRSPEKVLSTIAAVTRLSGLAAPRRITFDEAGPGQTISVLSLSWPSRADRRPWLDVFRVDPNRRDVEAAFGDHDGWSVMLFAPGDDACKACGGEVVHQTGCAAEITGPEPMIVHQSLGPRTYACGNPWGGRPNDASSFAPSVVTCPSCIARRVQHATQVRREMVEALKWRGPSCLPTYDRAAIDSALADGVIEVIDLDEPSGCPVYALKPVDLATAPECSGCGALNGPHQPHCYAVPSAARGLAALTDCDLSDRGVDHDPHGACFGMADLNTAAKIPVYDGTPDEVADQLAANLTDIPAAVPACPATYYGAPCPGKAVYDDGRCGTHTTCVTRRSVAEHFGQLGADSVDQWSGLNMLQKARLIEACQIAGWDGDWDACYRDVVTDVDPDAREHWPAEVVAPIALVPADLPHAEKCADSGCRLQAEADSDFCRVHGAARLVAIAKATYPAEPPTYVDEDTQAMPCASVPVGVELVHLAEHPVQPPADSFGLDDAGRGDAAVARIGGTS